MKKSLLIGAGFSYDFGMPIAEELSEILFELFNENNIKDFGHRLSLSNPYGEGRPINLPAILNGLALLLKHKNSGQENYENFIAELQYFSSEHNNTQSDKDSYHFLFGTMYEIIHTILSFYQEESFQLLYHINREYFSNFSKLLSENESWVFSLNHDLYLESLAVDLNIPITYGDNHQFSLPISNYEMGNSVHFTYSKRCELIENNQSFFNGHFGVNIVKLHGGLSELEYKDRQMVCNQVLKNKSSLEIMDDFIKVQKMAYYVDGQKIPSGKDRVITNECGELDIIRKSMLTGGKKYSKTSNPKDGEEKLLLFDNALQNINELSIIGYGFGDRHINNRISNAMVLNGNLRIIIVDPSRHPIPEFLEQFNYASRIKRVYSGVAQWIEYSYTNTWNTEQDKSLQKNKILREVIKDKVRQRLRELDR